MLTSFIFFTLTITLGYSKIAFQNFLIQWGDLKLIFLNEFFHEENSYQMLSPIL